MHLTSKAKTALCAALLISPLGLGAQAPSPADAKAFMGAWSIAVDGPAGPITLTLTVKEAAGKVVGEIGGDDVPLTPITEISKAGGNLVMKYSADVGGAVSPITLTAVSAGEKLTLTFDVGGQMTLPATGVKKP